MRQSLTLAPEYRGRGDQRNSGSDAARKQTVAKKED